MELIMLEDQKYAAVMHPLVEQIIGIRDCLDGLETIVEEALNKPDIHMHVFKECYQKFCTFGEELGKKIAILFLRPLPAVCFTDEDSKFKEDVAGITSKLSQENKILNRLNQRESSTLLETVPPRYIEHPSAAIHEYKIKQNILAEIVQLINTLEQLLQQLYCQRTDIIPLFAPAELPKRQDILKLFKYSVEKP